jgi:hypothetical protein
VDTSNLKLTIHLTDSDLDDEEKDEAAKNLLFQIEKIDEVEAVDRVFDPNPPEGNKSLGGFLMGVLKAEVKPSQAMPLLGFLSDRARTQPIEVELELEGRKLRVKADNPEELTAALQSLQMFLSPPSRPDTRHSILILTAHPQGNAQGNTQGSGAAELAQEVREIMQGLERSQQRDQFTLEQRWAVRPRDMRRAMLELRPRIVYFSGQGDEQGLIFEDESGKPQLVNSKALAGLFELFADRVECVVLNRCYSEVQARAIAQHIPYVIGMKQAIEHRAAIEFAIGFYDALGAGYGIEFAYQMGRNAMHMAGCLEHLVPELVKQPK